MGPDEMEKTTDIETISDISPEWLRSMAKRDNLLCNEIPHYPILVEHIRDYILHQNYEEKFLKTIQTVGEIIPDSERRGNIVTLTSGKDDQFPVNFHHLKLDDLYIREPTKIRCSVWEKYNAFKVFGTLERRGAETVLQVTSFKPVQDVDGTLQVISFLSRIAQCTHQQRGAEKEQMARLKDYWETSKSTGMRLVQKQDI